LTAVIRPFTVGFDDGTLNCAWNLSLFLLKNSRTICQSVLSAELDRLSPEASP
jgi:hypothetical protein